MMKNMFSQIGAFFVKLGKSLMLPIAVLPIAGLLLRFGQPDMLNIAFVAQAGGAVFDNLPLIFALGVAVGFAKESHGAAALSAFVGYVVMTAGMKTFNKDINMGVFGGIFIGVIAGLLYNRYKDIKLPQYLAFFGGRRFVPIVTGFFALVSGLVFSLIWPPAQNAITAFGDWIIGSGNIGLFAYGTANRLLIPLGLHHVLNTLVWFQFGDFVDHATQIMKHGDLWRFFAGDPAAGSFMTGFFPIMMFGLPAAALAMVMESYKDNKKISAGILLSAALTSFLTGITEPIEFAFMFLAFPLYVLHAVLTGFSMVIMNILHVKLGFTFSAGLFDYLLNYGISKEPLMLLPVGLAYGVLYFFLFRFVIRKWNLKTPGREDAPADASAPAAAKEEEPKAQIQAAPAVSESSSRAAKYLAGLGGKENIKTLEACATRLRVEVVDNAKIDESLLKSAGARAVVNSIKGSTQVVIGPEADLISDEIKAEMKK
jgi:PTS system N-acetylglucosamine-specific IIC component